MNNKLRSALLLVFGACFGVLLAHQEPTGKPVIESRLTNVVVSTMRIDSETSFYERTLGFKSFFRNKTCCFLKAGSVNLVFVVVAKKADVSKNLCLDVGVKDLTSAAAALTSAGIKVDRTDAAILKFADPDGNLVEVVRG